MKNPFEELLKEEVDQVPEASSGLVSDTETLFFLQPDKAITNNIIKQGYLFSIVLEFGLQRIFLPGYAVFLKITNNSFTLYK